MSIGRLVFSNTLGDIVHKKTCRKLYSCFRLVFKLSSDIDSVSLRLVVNEFVFEDLCRGPLVELLLLPHFQAEQ